MQTSQLFSEQKSSLVIDIIQINDDLCGFQATQYSIVNGVKTETSSEGISTLENILAYQELCTIPVPDEKYFVASTRFLELVRLYGHPSILDEYTSFDEFYPLNEMKAEIEANSVTFESVMLTPNIIDKLVLINYATHTIFNVNDNSLVNTARFSNNINISETYYSEYTNMVTFLLNNKRLNVIDNKKGYGDMFDTHYDSNFRYINATVVFTDEEFSRILKLTTIKNQHIDQFEFSKAIQKLDILDINKYIKTKQEREMDELSLIEE
jgi:hypothetical protein